MAINAWEAIFGGNHYPSLFFSSHLLHYHQPYQRHDDDHHHHSNHCNYDVDDDDDDDDGDADEGCCFCESAHTADSLAVSCWAKHLG